MIVWCAYCQQFRGESKPYDQYDLTHGICPECSKRGLDLDDEIFNRVDALKKIQTQIWAAGKAGDLSQALVLMTQAKTKGMRSIDFMAGLMAPLLYRIGDLWQQGQATIAEEHRFTAFCESAFELVKVQMPVVGSVARLPGEPLDILIVNADGNFHSIGIRLLELWCICEGLSARAVYPGLPPQELLRLVEELQPRALAISMSIEQQFAAVLEVRQHLAARIDAGQLKVFIGGYAVKQGLVPAIAGCELCPDAGAMLSYLQKTA